MHRSLQLYISFAIIVSIQLLPAQQLSGNDILGKVDKVMFSETKIITSTMIIHGRRESRTVESKSWQRGTRDAFTEYLSPPRELGTKMLKLGDMLWTYSPSTDRIIMISQHMLRQSVMGSDLSYEDMMEDPRLINLYTAAIAGEDTVLGRTCWILDLTAVKEEIAYASRRLWVDKSRFVALKEHLFAKSGSLLKTVDITEVMNVQNRWTIKSAVYKDVLKEGKGTEFRITSIEFDAAIPDHIFTKASLRQ
ncbi:MAG: outer membrane lipoprotein-sorting protein [Bacteroidota bacterium]